ncbi:hypothetical protein AcV5_008248 [Taiwanofungus camphoratus]|nr:hypothetical protein AcV5_008248 [Antrodia cinnamomea]
MYTSFYIQYEGGPVFKKSCVLVALCIRSACADERWPITSVRTLVNLKVRGLKVEDARYNIRIKRKTTIHNRRQWCVIMSSKPKATHRGKTRGLRHYCSINGASSSLESYNTGGGYAIKTISGEALVVTNVSIMDLHD